MFDNTLTFFSFSSSSVKLSWSASQGKNKNNSAGKRSNGCLVRSVNKQSLNIHNRDFLEYL